ncbi:hypothetical protein GCE9029_02296 [Grimontia celer]|uniref:NIPSNAP domain-containing protein n=2 Tax=Grimontia celer TaxID=1796497 RepID=A0A128F2D0_9GAMM|nr:hypothetical protein GCE9029_02296 [Grimontia celer]
MISMHGLYELKPEQDQSEFEQAFTAYAKQLYDMGLNIGWQSFSRRPHPGYNLAPPDQEGLVAMFFEDDEQANRCWDVVSADEEPIASLHRGVNQKVTNISFFYSDVNTHNV